MKSKNPKIQILKKGIATFMSAMLLATPMVYATTSLDDSYLQSTWWDKILYGTIGSTAREIEEYLASPDTTLYITNETQLRAFAEYVNNGNDCYQKEIVLLNDIQVDSSVEWTPIQEFNGTFDGQGHVIRGIKYIREGRTYENLSHIGFFGKILSSGTVQNLIVEDFNINIIYDENDINLEEHDQYYHSVGNIAGSCEGVIQYCTNYSDIYGAYNVGGIVGNLANDGKVKNCYNKGNVQAYQRAGGIAGLAYGESHDEEDAEGQIRYDNQIINCINEGEIVAEKSVGGILGLAGHREISSESLLIQNSLSKGSVKATNSAAGSAGGVIGKSISEVALIEDCTNAGTIEIVGGTGSEPSSDNAITIYNCTTVNANNTSNITEDNVTDIIGAISNTDDTRTLDVNGEETDRGFNSANILDENNQLMMDIQSEADDGSNPTVEPTVYIENALEFGRYTAGKDIIIEVKTNERINAAESIRPELEIIFSKSGVGKYNYNGERAGLAKCIDARINLDGTTTWTYVYQIQEFDEGNLQIKYVSGRIKDLTGNENILASRYEENIAQIQSGSSSWNNNVEVELQFYKNSTEEANKITNKTYFLEEDNLLVVATFNKALYAYKYNVNINGRDYNDEKIIDVSTAPSLYLPTMETNIEANIVNVDVDTENNKTVITYECQDIVNNYEKLTNLKNLKLVNENNRYTVQITERNVTVTQEETAQPIKYIINGQASLNELTADASKKYNIQNILIDPIQVSVNPDYEVYADTTPPRVEITPWKVENGKTNESVSMYIIQSNELITELTKDNITIVNGEILFWGNDVTGDGRVNMGDVANLFSIIRNSMPESEMYGKYDMDLDGDTDEDDIQAIFDYVKSANRQNFGFETENGYIMFVKNHILQGTSGELKVIIEQNSCQDKVGLGNIRQENVITIDKIKPTLTLCEAKKEGNNIIVEATFSEAISDLSELQLSLTAGGNLQRGTWATNAQGERDVVMLDYNKAKFTYNISGADGGEVKVTLNGTVKDVAGNNSEQLNASVDTNIILEQEVINANGKKYSFEKNGTAITDFSNPTYCEPGDKIVVKEYYETVGEDENSVTNEIVYDEYTVPNNDRNLGQIITIKSYSYTGEDGNTYYKISCHYNEDGNINISEANIYFDAVLPGLTGNVYVQDTLENGRYPKGTEITIDVTTSEIIDATNTVVPEVLVSFSESGVGKYNYIEGKGSGYAIKTSERINEGGSTTWTYTYIVQEFDEGNAQVEYKTGKIVDLTGHEINIETMNNSANYQPSTSNSVSGDEWGTGTEDIPLGINYKIYKNNTNPSNEVTATTYFTQDDDIYVTVEFDKVLYVCCGEANGKNHNVRLNNDYKDRAPSLYIEGETNLKCTIESITTSSNKTQLKYKLVDLVKQSGTDTLTKLTKLVLKNENNQENISVTGSSVSTAGIIPFSGEYYQEYNGNGSQKYDQNTIGSGKTKVITGITNVVLDPLKISDKVSDITVNNIYADTTAPTVTITSNKSNPTNAETIEYTFEWSEEVDGFGAEDITIIGAEIDKNEDGTDKFTKNGNTYTLTVKHNVQAGNEGEVQVIVEQDVCKDKIGLGNVRSENKIVLDKKAPTVEIRANKDKVNGTDKVTYEFIWSELVEEFVAEDITVNNGEKGNLSGEGNYYTLEVTPNGGNDVEVSVTNGVCTDIAGNENIASSKHVIPVMPTVTITSNKPNPTNANEITYTFIWSEEVTGFDQSDLILPNGATGTLDPNSNTIRVNYGGIIPTGHQGDVTIAVKENAVQDSNGYGNAYTSNTTKIDKVKPTLTSYEAKQEGNKIILEAIFSETISNISELSAELKIGENTKENPWNNAEILDNKARFAYDISNADGGKVKVTLNGKAKDKAGNDSEQINQVIETDITLVQSAIKVDGIEYRFYVKKSGTEDFVQIADFSQPTRMKLGEELKITMSKTLFAGYTDDKYKEVTYTIKPSDKNNALVKNMKIGIWDSDTNTQIVQCFFDDNTRSNEDFKVTPKVIAVSEVNIYFDQELPGIEGEVYVNRALEHGRYPKGTEITIDITTSEAIDLNQTVLPEIQVSFSESGVGKYNYIERKGSGYAIKTSEKTNDNGSTTWTYTYIVQEFDEGTISVEYKGGKIVDLAGHEVDVMTFMNEANGPVYSGNGTWGNIIERYEVYCNNTKVTSPTYFKYYDNIKIKVIFNKCLYTCCGADNGTGHDAKLTKDRAPSLFIGSKLKYRASAITHDTTTTITYDLGQIASEFDELTKVKQIVLKNENNGANYQPGTGAVILTNGIIPYYDSASKTFNTSTIKSGSIHKIENNNGILLLDPYEIHTKVEDIEVARTIYADTTEPTVTITTGQQNLTNPENIEYTFIWSEEVVGFTVEDITVKNGTKGELSEATHNADGTYSYTMNVIPNVAPGSTAEVQVIVEANRCKDKVGFGNARQENVITITKPLGVPSSIRDSEGNVYTFAIQREGETEYANITNFLIPTYCKIGDKIKVIKNNDANDVYEYTVGTNNLVNLKHVTHMRTHNDGSLNFYYLENGGPIDIAEANIYFDKIAPTLTTVLIPNMQVSNNVYKEGAEFTIRATTNEMIQEVTEIPTMTVKFGGEEGKFNNGNAQHVETIKISNETTTFVYRYVVSSGDNGSVELEYSGNLVDLAGNAIVPEYRTDNITADTTLPTISEAVANGNVITITANEENAEYAISSTTEVPAEWSTDSTIEVAEDGVFYAWVKDSAGNITMKAELVVVDTTAPELTITTDVELDKWTNSDIKVNVKSNEELSYLVVNAIGNEEQGVSILATTTYEITSNGEYEIVAKDNAGNETKEIINVENIDEIVPEISSAVPNGKSITITATDEGGSEIAEYAISSTTEVPVEWSTDSTIKVAEDGTFYAWVKDNAGNVSKTENIIVIDTTAPTIMFNYRTLLATVGENLEVDVITNENAIIAYKWNNENWVESEGYISNLSISKDATAAGTYTLYVKAKDNAENESTVQTIEFTVTTSQEEVVNPEIIFEDLPIMQIDGVKYVKVSADMTSEDLTNKINETALCGATPEYTKLTEDNKLRTGSEITINGETKYIIVVNGDVNCDGNVEAIDVTYANRVRLGRIKSNTIQELAADFDLNGEIEALDITMINRYRLGKIKGI